MMSVFSKFRETDIKIEIVFTRSGILIASLKNQQLLLIGLA